MIAVEGINKNFGNIKAVNNVSFHIGKGEIIGFLGPNGAGKTTTMRMLTGYYMPDSGSIRIKDIDITRNPIDAKKTIGYLPEDNPVYYDITPYDYLLFVAGIRGIPKAQFSRRLKEVASSTGITNVISRPIGELSKGYKQRVGLAQALIHDPDILILDEPTSGLDPTQIVEIRELIKRLSREKTVILSTHIMQEASAISTRILIINKGSIVAKGTPSELLAFKEGANIVHILVKKEHKAFSEKLKESGFGVSVKSNDEKFVELIITGSKDVDIRENIFNLAVQNNVALLEMWKEKATLEEVFLHITMEEKHEA